MDEKEKGEELLIHKSDGWELAPKFIVNRLNDREKIFSDITIYENGIGLRYFSEEKKPIFINYSKIRKILVFTKIVSGPFKKGQYSPVWLEIHAPPHSYRIYHSLHFPLNDFEKIMAKKDCPLERKNIDEATFWNRNTEEDSPTRQ